jgi:hypothetical protein
MHAGHDLDFSDAVSADAGQKDAAQKDVGPVNAPRASVVQENIVQAVLDLGMVQGALKWIGQRVGHAT